MNSDLAPQITRSMNGTPLVPTNVANPCGLIAKSVFTDSYSLSPTTFVNGKVLPQAGIKIDDSDIAWNSDVKYKFKNLDSPYYQSIMWTDVTNRKPTPSYLFRTLHSLDAHFWPA
jgi:LEM3 (ligand-effect modulator 3) family / CDC50 family